MTRVKCWFCSQNKTTRSEWRIFSYPQAGTLITQVETPFSKKGFIEHFSVVQFFQDDSENAPREAFYQENNKPRMILLDRKGAGAIDAFDDEISPNVSIDSDYSRLHAVPGANQQTFDEEKDGEKRNFTERTDEELVETQIENWDGGVEVYRSQSMKSGWSSKWNKNWTQFRYPSLVTLPELHNARYVIIHTTE